MTASKKSLSTSAFYMWRCLVALAHADGKLQKEELDYFEKVFDNLPRYYALTQAQRDAFANDLYTPQDIDALFSHINDPEARAVLIGFAEDLALIDGNLHPNEKDILQKLHLKNPRAYDTEELLGDIRRDIEKNRLLWEKERAAMRETARARNPLFTAVDIVLMRFGIDILDH